MRVVSDKPLEPPALPARRARPRRKDPLGPDSEIGIRLRALYTEAMNDPVPADIIDLLEQLDKAERQGGK